jgi:hypothetical protein|eukprot:COSAG01_NODE_612_length_14837_cov_1336.717058_6_plen_321_part_00
MINSVRNTVLAILNKNNYGYISPQDFNLFAKQAQLDIFEDYFYQYNYQLNKENKRMSGTGYADITKGYEEVIDLFSVTLPLTQSSPSTNNYLLPSLLTTNNDYYLINKMLVNDVILTSGITTATVGGQNKIIDGTADFIADGVSVGDIVGITIGGISYNLSITLVENGTTLVISPNLVNITPLDYVIYQQYKNKEIEKVTHSKITLLNNSILTSPSLEYPAYTTENLSSDIFPPTINNPGQVICQYIRYPFDPQWTYTTLSGGEPVFNQSNPSYQDFELTIDDEPTLIMKILQFAGMSIREIQAVQFGLAAEQYEDTKEK